MLFSQMLKSHRILKRPAKALIRLRICAGCSEPLLVEHALMSGLNYNALKWILLHLLLYTSLVKITQVISMIYDKKKKIFFSNILYVVRLEPKTAISSIQRAKRDSDGYTIRKYTTLKSIIFIMIANQKLVLRSIMSLYGIFMSANLTLLSYKQGCY